MANEMLKFRKGLYANLPETKAAGTIYVTTDEKAMYVDVSATERIRIGDFIRVATVKDITPPYSTSSLYYVEADNALLKYVVKDGETTGEWKQVNGTDDIKESIEGLEKLIGDNADAIAEVSGIVGKEAKGEDPATGLVKKVADNAAAIAQNAEDIEKNAEDIKNIQDAIGLGEGEGTITKRLEDLESFQEAAQDSIDDHGNRIGALETASAKHAEKTYVDETFATKANTYTKAEVYTQAEADGKIAAAVKEEADRAKLAEQANANAAGAAQSKADEAFTLAGQKATLDEVKALNYATKGEAQEMATTAKNDAIADAAGKYATKEALEGVSGAAGAAQQRADDAYALAETKTTMAEVEAKKYATETKAQEMATKAKDDAIADAATKYTTISDNQATLKAANDAMDAAKAAQSTANQGVSDAAAADGKASQALTNAATADGKAVAAQQKADSAYNLADTANKAAEGAQKTADDNADAIEEIKENYATKEEVEQVEEDLTAKIDADIKAVNAMTYKGTVDGVQSVLPTSGVKIGDTYAVSTGFTGDFGPVKPGDLLIATATENTEGDNGEITGTVKWHVVYTGYSDALNPALDAADNQIKLSSLGGSNGDLGVVQLVAEGAASVRTVVATETTPTQIFVGTVWEDF